jgi:enterochelin esterase-like enzyme
VWRAFRQWLRWSAVLGLAALIYAPVQRPESKPWPPETPWNCPDLGGRIVTISVPSQSYHQPVPASVYLPPCYLSLPGDLPVIYLLHGGGTDETQWPDLRVREEADALIGDDTPPFVVVMPGGYYAVDLDYENFVLSDLIPGVEQQLHVRRDAAGRAIGGISLGGFWALKTAFEHPDLFAAVGGHSPVLNRGAPDDPSVLAQTAPGLDHLQITLDAAELDSLLPSAQQLASTLSARGLSVTFSTGPGGHNRPYWRAHTGDYLRFYLAAIAPPQPAIEIARDVSPGRAGD